MTNAQADTAVTVLQLRCEQRTYPPYDHLHGTPHAMLQRLLRIETTKGSATFEQTDYGHPGKLNPWDPRGIDSALQGKTAQLKALADAAGALLE
jgi:hypothetical protein